jgi:DNA topoisomerase-1
VVSKLVIVESPAKARTLNTILGRSYKVKASLGHVRDLPKGNLGVDIDKGFAPKYVVPPEKKKTVNEIRKAASEATSVYLATDPDREGEAISWHLVQAGKLNKDSTAVQRVVFHEVTKDAVLEAFRSPRSIDMNLVNAQQARRILDRLVGYKLSPLLWRKVQRGLSAGRVQSVAVRMIVDREREIQDFVPKEYWVMDVELAPPKEKQASFKARLFALVDGAKLDIGNKDEAEGVAADLEKAQYAVKSVATKQVGRQPAPPFITSTLQQEASQRLHLSPGRTMAIAQQLYEGLPLGKEGSVGLITYMRTDSTHVAASAISETRKFVGEKYGSEFLPPKARTFARKSKWAQEAHEAIRPTQIYREPQHLKPFLNPTQLKLYELIWKRMVASHMSAALYNTTSVEIEAINTGNRRRGYLLKATSSVVKFTGFMIVYSESKSEDEREERYVSLPKLKTADELIYLGIFPEQAFTQPPPRYTEATLIKALEQKGIGRPSTYAPILSTIQERDYVKKEGGRFCPTDLGTIVNRILTEHFPRIVDPGFTARMEEQLDEIAQGKHAWTSALQEFYPPFQDRLDKAWTNLEKVSTTQPSEEKCPNCGRPMVVKVGRFGKFLACSGYPDCKTTRPYMVKTGVSCPKCGGELVQRISKKRKLFYGCSNFPKCRFVVNRRPVAHPCPSCGNLLIQYRGNWAKCVACQNKVELSQLEKQEEEVTS